MKQLLIDKLKRKEKEGGGQESAPGPAPKESKKEQQVG